MACLRNDEKEALPNCFRATNLTQYWARMSNNIKKESFSSFNLMMNMDTLAMLAIQCVSGVVEQTRLSDPPGLRMQAKYHPLFHSALCITWQNRGSHEAPRPMPRTYTVKFGDRSDSGVFVMWVTLQTSKCTRLREGELKRGGKMGQE